MQTIKTHIQQNQYKQIYLLYGSEDYLKKLYKNKLKDGMIGQDDGMNLSYFEGKGLDINKVVEIAQTLPFFTERRLIIIEQSGLFKSQNDLADAIKQFPSTTHVVFVESEVDKRNRLYKTVKDIGTISEMNGLDEKNLGLWIVSLLGKDKKKITAHTVSYFLSKTGADMEHISRELEKLVCFAYDRDSITIEDVDAVCTTQLTNKIFQMIDAIAGKKQDTALALYYDLLALKEKPTSILYLITRHFNLLLQVKELTRLGYNNTIISQKAGLPPFAVGKYITQGKNFKSATLIQALHSCTNIEEQIKTGILIDKIGVELLIVTYSQS